MTREWFGAEEGQDVRAGGASGWILPSVLMPDDGQEVLVWLVGPWGSGFYIAERADLVNAPGEKIGDIWVQVKKIAAPVRSPFMLFGQQVAINGETAVVSAPSEAISLPGGGVANGAGAV